MTLLDTHAWIWWVDNPDKLSEAAQEEIRKAVAESSLYVSSMSVWELAMLVSKDRLQLKLDVGDWLSHTEALPYVTFVPVNNRIALNAMTLALHPDPADRIIVATALYLGATLVTKDDKLRTFEKVTTVW